MARQNIDLRVRQIVFIKVCNLVSVSAFSSGYRPLKNSYLLEDLQAFRVVQKHSGHFLWSSFRLKHSHDIIAQIHVDQVLADVQDIWCGLCRLLLWFSRACLH